MRYRVWINDSTGIHSPSHQLGSRRAAEVFAANRSRFRRDAFVLVCEDSSDKPVWLVIYVGGRLKDAKVPGAFTPEPVVAYVNGGAVYALTQQATMKGTR